MYWNLAFWISGNKFGEPNQQNNEENCIELSKYNGQRGFSLNEKSCKIRTNYVCVHI